MSSRRIDTCPCCGARHFKVLDPKGELAYDETHWEYQDDGARVQCLECKAIYDLSVGGRECNEDDCSEADKGGNEWAE